jgi:hypothetical protein
MEPAFESMRDGTITSRFSDHQWLLPYENSPWSGVLTSVIRQLWGIVGGVEEGGIKEEANGRELSDSIMTVSRPDTLLGGETAGLAEMETERKVQEEALSFKFASNSIGMMVFLLGRVHLQIGCQMMDRVRRLRRKRLGDGSTPIAIRGGISLIPN